jgi:hypothetical protein
MAEQEENQQQITNLPAELPAYSKSVSVVSDVSLFEHMQRVAKIFAASNMVPETFAGNVPNCFVAVEMANRMGINAMALMQNMGMVKGKPTLEAKLITALINDSGMFEEDLSYEVVGTDPSWDKAANKPTDPKYKVRAFAKSKRTGEILYGEWVTWDMVQGEGWHAKTGSKWLTMPGMMFRYRAASYFGKIYCTNITMGMQTRDEMEDVAPAGSHRVARASSVVAGILGAGKEEAVDAEVVPEDKGENLPE